MSAVSFKPVKGMSDIHSPEVELWQGLEASARGLLACYDFHEVRTPIVENVSVFTHSLGEASEVVEKQMYSFERSKETFCLRPEGTAGVMRYVGGNLQDNQQARLYYIGPMFRAEQPQAGRKRQFHQLGVECIGEASAEQDAEVLQMQAALLKSWGLNNVRFQLNTRGSLEDFPKVLAGLRAELEPQRDALCEDCQRRLQDNVLRVLDCKVEHCKDCVQALPPITRWMAPESLSYFEKVQACLRNLGVDFEVNPLLVRGLDYYQHTIWEVTCSGLGAQDAVAGGGRYVMKMGKQQLEGVGFGIGMERVILALSEEAAARVRRKEAPLLILVSMSDAARDRLMPVAAQCRDAGLRVRMDLGGRSLKAQMKAAARLDAAYVGVVGDSELETGTLQLKDMAARTQKEISLDALIPELSGAG